MRSYQKRKPKKYKIAIKSLGIVIERVIKCIPLGNFCPFYCTYNRKVYLVQSEEGDISDPFRAEKSYLDSLYIELEKPCSWTQL